MGLTKQRPRSFTEAIPAPPSETRDRGRSVGGRTFVVETVLPLFALPSPPDQLSILHTVLTVFTVRAVPTVLPHCTPAKRLTYTFTQLIFPSSDKR